MASITDRIIKFLEQLDYEVEEIDAALGRIIVARLDYAWPNNSIGSFNSSRMVQYVLELEESLGLPAGLTYLTTSRIHSPENSIHPGLPISMELIVAPSKFRSYDDEIAVKKIAQKVVDAVKAGQKEIILGTQKEFERFWLVTFRGFIMKILLDLEQDLSSRVVELKTLADDVTSWLRSNKFYTPKMTSVMAEDIDKNDVLLALYSLGQLDYKKAAEVEQMILSPAERRFQKIELNPKRRQ